MVFMQLLRSRGDREKTNHTQAFHHLPVPDPWNFVDQRRVTFPIQPHPASLSDSPNLRNLPFWISPIDSPVTYMIMSDYLMVALSSLLSVMHESSKRVSETLQEIYSSKWEGHEELKAIVAVRVCWALQLFHSHPTLISASSQLLCPSKQENKGASSHCFLYSPDHRW